MKTTAAIVLAIMLTAGLTACGETPEQRYDDCMASFAASGMPDNPDMPASMVCYLATEEH